MSGSRTRARQILFNKQGGCCHYCGRMMYMTPHPTLQCTVDHVVPRSENGVDHISNYVGACIQCNGARGTIPASVFLRYVRRFGPALDWKLSISNRARRRAAEHMRENGLSEPVINDLLAAKLTEAFRARSSNG